MPQSIIICRTPDPHTQPAELSLSMVTLITRGQIKCGLVRILHKRTEFCKSSDSVTSSTGCLCGDPVNRKSTVQNGNGCQWAEANCGDPALPQQPQQHRTLTEKRRPEQQIIKSYFRTLSQPAVTKTPTQSFSAMTSGLLVGSFHDRRTLTSVFSQMFLQSCCNTDHYSRSFPQLSPAARSLRHLKNLVYMRQF